ncbi:MAG: sulfite exporter TauE/SafE family protein [bacterium]|nr:sulfite exporter TauE/SafE family protein [bacterium]
MNSIWLAFLTGLTTGGLSCLAVQGGLLASSVAKHNPGSDQARIKQMTPIAIFLSAKLIGYILLGFLLGYAGSYFSLSPNVVGWMQIIVGVFLLATAARVSDIHPMFRYLVITPPRFVYRHMRNVSRAETGFAPGLLGFFTVFLPCGVTQAMMVVAVASGNPWLGAGIMGAFVLGTSPLFFLLGMTLEELLKRKIFAYVASGIIGVFGILSFNGGLGLHGSIYTLQNFYKAAVTDTSTLSYDRALGDSSVFLKNGKQEVTIRVQSDGYVPSTDVLKKGVPVRLTLETDGTRGCSRAFTMASMNISKVLPETGAEIVEFTPTKAGRLAYACGMGMYTGSFTVIP